MRRWIGRFAVLTMLVGLSAMSACDTGPEIVPAKFISRPSRIDIDNAYPAFARMAHIPGRVRMRCEYSTVGVLERCRKLAVAPEGMNFDKWVPRLLSKYVVQPQTLGGAVAPAPIEFTIVFDPPTQPPPIADVAPTDAEMAIMRRGLSLNLDLETRIAQDAAARSVELDRMNVVREIVDHAYAAEGHDRRDVLMRGIIEAMSSDQRAELLSRPNYMVLPNRLEVERISPTYFARSQALATRMRTEYCAAYSCSAELPTAAAAR